MANIVKMAKGKRTVKVVDTAFEKVWKPRGWKLVDEKKTAVSPAPKPTGESATSS